MISIEKIMQEEGFGLGLKIVKDICDKNLVIINLQSDE